MWGVSLTHPMLPSFLCVDLLLLIPCCLDFYVRSLSDTFPAGFVVLSGEFLLHIPCCVFFFFFFFPVFFRGSFSYTSRAGFIFNWGVSLTHPVLASFLNSGVSLTHPMLALFLSGEYLLHIQFFFFLNMGIFSYTSRADFIFIWGVSLTHPVLASLLSGEFLLHIPCWLHFYPGSFSSTSCAGFIFMRGVSFTHPLLTLFLCGEFLLHIPC